MKKEDKDLAKICARIEKQRNQLIELDKSNCDDNAMLEKFTEIINEDKDKFSSQRFAERYLYLLMSEIEDNIPRGSTFYIVKDKTFNNICNGCEFFDWLKSSGFKSSKEVGKPIYKESLRGIADYLYVNPTKKMVVFAIYDVNYTSGVDRRAITIDAFKAIYSNYKRG